MRPRLYMSLCITQYFRAVCGAQLATLCSRARRKQADPTRRSTYLAYLAYPTKSSFVLRMMLRSVKGTDRAGRPPVDGRKGRSTYVELGKLVELDVYLVLRAALALSLDLLGLPSFVSTLGMSKVGKDMAQLPDPASWLSLHWPAFGWQS